ncbi:MAG: hypothetical protein JJ863_05100 [Deltaproteobacteria bacterium]|nr:hypothetical protein [Deltaproteobacteria bacterium]
MLGRSPYGRDDHPAGPPLPEAEERVETSFVRGTGPYARKMWRSLGSLSTLMMLTITAAAGFGSETAGVVFAHFTAGVVGFFVGGYFGVIRAQRAGPRVGRPLPIVGAVLGAAISLAMAATFFVVIWPSL